MGINCLISSPKVFRTHFVSSKEWKNSLEQHVCSVGRGAFHWCPFLPLNDADRHAYRHDDHQRGRHRDGRWEEPAQLLAAPVCHALVPGIALCDAALLRRVRRERALLHAGLSVGADEVRALAVRPVRGPHEAVVADALPINERLLLRTIAEAALPVHTQHAYALTFLSVGSECESVCAHTLTGNPYKVMRTLLEALLAVDAQVPSALAGLSVCFDREPVLARALPVNADLVSGALGNAGVTTVFQ